MFYFSTLWNDIINAISFVMVSIYSHRYVFLFLEETENRHKCSQSAQKLTNLLILKIIIHFLLRPATTQLYHLYINSRSSHASIENHASTFAVFITIQI